MNILEMLFLGGNLYSDFKLQTWKMKYWYFTWRREWQKITNSLISVQ